jgi:hypothetical protein
MLTRIQNYIEAGDNKLNELQVRFNKLSDIFNRYDTAQSELELSDTDHTSDRESFENQHFQVEARFTELLHPAIEPLQSRHRSPQSSVSSHSNQTPRSTHTSLRSSTSRQSDQTPRSQTGSSHMSLPSISLPTFAGDTCTWLHYRDTFEALVVNNSTLSNVQKFHYLIAYLQMKQRV